MEFDPLSRDIGPPRHEIESDSEDEAGEGSNGGQQPRQSFKPPQVQVSHGAEAEGRELIIFEGDGGEVFLQLETGRWIEDGKVIIDGEQHGSLAIANDLSAVALLLRPSIGVLSEQAKYAYICSSIVESLRPARLTIVGDYNPALYLSSQEVYEPPIRYISSQENSLGGKDVSNLKSFESPNYVLGLGAAMLNESGMLGVPATLLLLPLATNSHLQTWSRIQATSSSLDTPPDALDAQLASLLSLQLPLSAFQSTSAKGSNTHISDFLHHRRSQARRKLGQNVSAMYV